MRDLPSANPFFASSLDEPVIHLNNERLPWRAGLTVAALLQAQQVDGMAVATAVNGEFVPRGARADRVLLPGDQVTVLKPIVGG